MIPVNVEATVLPFVLSLAAGTPLIMALLCCTPFRKKIIGMAYWAALPALIVALISPLDRIVEVDWFFMGGRMGLDETGRTFLLLAGFIWLAASISCQSLFKNDRHRVRFYTFFFTAMAGNFGLILARGMLGYYLFFAMMSFAAYGLVVHRANKNAIDAGRLYLILVMVGEVALFTAMIILAHSSGSLALEDIVGFSCHPMTFALLFVGFGVKIGALPFHSWMMPAYQAAPIPVAAALAGSMVNAGILGWLRFLPLGHTSSPEGGVLFIIAGAVAALYGVITGLGKKQAGSVLGGSSISQMGLITVIFGMGLLDKNAGILAVPVLIIYVVHHSLAKSSLFLGYDLVERQGKNVSHLQLTALLLPALALAGLPFTSGAIAKTAFKELALSLGEPWSTLSTFFFPVTAMTTTLLMLHFMVVIRCNKGKEKPGRRTSRIIFALSFLTVAMTLWLWPAASNFAGHSITGTKIMQGLWPIAGASFLFFVWRRVFITAKIPTKDQKKIFDLDALIDRVTKLLQEKEVAKPQANKLLIFLHTLVPYLRKTEKIMGRWKVVGISYIALCLSLLFLLLL